MIEIEAKRSIQLLSLGKVLQAGQKIVLETKPSPAQEKELSKAQKVGLIRMTEVKTGVKPPVSTPKASEKNGKAPAAPAPLPTPAKKEEKKTTWGKKQLR